MMKYDEKIISEHSWIPWQRYVLFLNIDNSKKKIGRVMRRDTACREASLLSVYKGYDPEILDSKTGEIIDYETHLPILQQQIFD